MIMKKSKGAFGCSGTFDWMVQRISAIVIAVFLLTGIIALSMFKGQLLSYELWVSWFAPQWMKVATFVTLIALCIHAWIGIWSVATDYVKKCQGLFLAIIGLGLVGCLYWGVVILWGL